THAEELRSRELTKSRKDASLSGRLLFPTLLLITLRFIITFVSVVTIFATTGIPTVDGIGVGGERRSWTSSRNRTSSRSEDYGREGVLREVESGEIIFISVGL